MPPFFSPPPLFFILSAYGELTLDSGHFLIYSFDFFLWNGYFSFLSTCPMTSVPSRTQSSLPMSIVVEQLLVTLTMTVRCPEETTLCVFRHLECYTVASHSADPEWNSALAPLNLVPHPQLPCVFRSPRLLGCPRGRQVVTVSTEERVQMFFGLMKLPSV